MLKTGLVSITYFDNVKLERDPFVAQLSKSEIWTLDARNQDNLGLRGKLNIVKIEILLVEILVVSHI